MRLVIEIPKYAYKLIKEYFNELPDGDEIDAKSVYSAEGTPLDSVLEDIKAEIRAHSEMHYMDGDIIADELLEIIDKHMRGEE